MFPLSKQIIVFTPHIVINKINILFPKTSPKSIIDFDSEKKKKGKQKLKYCCDNSLYEIHSINWTVISISLYIRSLLHNLCILMISSNKKFNEYKQNWKVLYVSGFRAAVCLYFSDYDNNIHTGKLLWWCMYEMRTSKSEWKCSSFNFFFYFFFL